MVRMKESARQKSVSLAVSMACIRPHNLLPRNLSETSGLEISVLHLDNLHVLKD